MFYCKRYSSSCLVSIFWIARTKEQYQQRFLALALTQYRFLAFSLPCLFTHLLLTFEFAFTLLHSRALHPFITQRENASGPIRTLPILINNQFKKVELPWRPYEGEDTMKEIRVLYRKMTRTKGKAIIYRVCYLFQCQNLFIYVLKILKSNSSSAAFIMCL